jgi:hypothetical protein
MNVEGVFEDEACSLGYFFIREDVSAYGEDLFDAGEVEALDEEPDVVAVASTCGEDFHGEEVFGGGC